MVRLTICLVFWSVSTAFAACQGQDLRSTLSASEADAISAAVTQTPFATGNHWIARRGTQRIDVIGTMHLNTPGMATAAEKLSPIIEQADVVLFESTPAELAEFEVYLSKNLSLVLLENGPTLVELLPPKDWDTLSGILRQQGMPPWMGSKMKPWFLTMALSIPPCVRTTPELKRGLDTRLSEFATAFGVPQKSLESPLYLIQRFDRFTLRQQIDMLMASPNTLLSSEDAFTTLVAMYFEGRSFEAMQIVNAGFARDSLLDAEETAALLEGWETTLLDERNALWLPLILEETAPRVVVAVGAGHLPGEAGVLRLLEVQGFTLARGEF